MPALRLHCDCAFADSAKMFGRAEESRHAKRRVRADLTRDTERTASELPILFGDQFSNLEHLHRAR